MARKVKKKDVFVPAPIEKKYQAGVTFENPPDKGASYFYLGLLFLTIAVGISVISYSPFVSAVLIVLGILAPVLFLNNEYISKPTTVRTESNGIVLTYRNSKQEEVSWDDMVKVNLVAVKVSKKPEKKGKSGGVLKIKGKRTPILMTRAITEQVIAGYKASKGQDPPR